MLNIFIIRPMVVKSLVDTPPVAIVRAINKEVAWQQYIYKFEQEVSDYVQNEFDIRVILAPTETISVFK